MLIRNPAVPMEGRIQEQISISARRFLKEQGYPKEPLYKTLDRVLGKYRLKDIAPIEEENKQLHVAVKCYIERIEQYKKEILSLTKQVEKLNRIANGTKLTEFLE